MRLCTPNTLRPLHVSAQTTVLQVMRLLAPLAIAMRVAVLQGAQPRQALPAVDLVVKVGAEGLYGDPWVCLASVLSLTPAPLALSIRCRRSASAARPASWWAPTTRRWRAQQARTRTRCTCPRLPPPPPPSRRHARATRSTACTTRTPTSPREVRWRPRTASLTRAETLLTARTPWSHRGQWRERHLHCICASTLGAATGAREEGVETSSSSLRV